MNPQRFTPQQALPKAKHYCAYQERCHSEVREKLYSLGIWKKDHDELVSKLIEENYLDEERFAIAFAGGKFRIKQWGKIKIKYELKQKQVSEYSIKKALNEINEDDYLKTLQKLVETKYESLKGEQYLIRKKKTADYLIGRGFEYSLFGPLLNQLTETRKK